MPFGQLYDSVKGLPSPWNAIALWVIALVLAVVFFFKTVKIVHQDEMAMKLRRGRVIMKRDKATNEARVAVYRAGIRGLFPFIDTLIRVSIRDRTYNLGTTNIQVGEYDVSDVDVTVTLSIDPEGIYHIHFKNDELERRTIALCLSLLRPILHAHRDELHSDDSDIRERITKAFAEAAARPLAELGFRSPVIEVTDVRTNAQALIAKAIAGSKKWPIAND